MYNNHCYGFIEPEQETWEDARNYCRKLDGDFDLVVVNDDTENQFLQNKIQSIDAEFWFGLKEDGIKDNYVWVDNSVLEYGKELKSEPWSWGEPNSVSTIHS